jgi:hypothetical protein
MKPLLRFILNSLSDSAKGERIAKGVGMTKKSKTVASHNSIVRSSAAEYLTFVAAGGRGGVEAIYADENVWLTQKMMAVLYDVDVRTVNYHLKKVFSDGELQESSVIRNFRITAADDKNYDTKHYNLAAIIAVGYKVNSERAVQFRKWATAIVESFTIKLNRFIEATDREVLQDAGKVTAEIARAHAESEFEKYRVIQDHLFESDFDRLVKQLPQPKKGNH